MSLTSSELRKLAALNLSPEQMAGVLGLLADRVEAEETRRAAQAERKRKSRDKRVTVTGQVRDMDVTPSPLVPPLEVSPTPPSKTPPIIPPSNSDLLSGAALEARLREAAGWQNEPHPNLFVVGCIETLLQNGASLETDVLPVIRGRARNVRRPSGWNYFVDAIRDAMANRQKAATGPPQKPNSAVPEKSFEQLAQELVPGWKPGTKYASSTG